MACCATSALTASLIAALAELHWATPAPVRPGRFVPAPFDVIAPLSPAPMVLGLTERFLPGRRQAAEAAQLLREATFRADTARHEMAKAAHEARNTEDRMAYSAAIAGNPQPMQRLLERRLGEIQWPKETMVEVAVDDDGSGLTLDVDLPEIEHMPGQRATVAARALDITYKDAGEVATRKLYRQHIHALGFRMIGEAFAAP